MATITKVYDTYAAAQKAVADLEQAGIPASDISLVANKHVSSEYEGADDKSETAQGAGIGAALGGGAGLLAGLGLLAIPGLGPVVAAGWLAATAVGAATGGAAGGLIGALMESGETEHDANLYSEAVRRGGTLVTVRPRDDAHEAVARKILEKYQPIDPLTRADEYRRAGWSRFDPDAPPYEPSAADIERMRRPL